MKVRQKIIIIIIIYRIIYLPVWNGFKSDKIVDDSLWSARECFGNTSIFVYLFEDENKHLLEEYNDKVFDKFLSNVVVVILFSFCFDIQMYSRNLGPIYICMMIFDLLKKNLDLVQFIVLSGIFQTVFSKGYFYHDIFVDKIGFLYSI